MHTSSTRVRWQVVLMLVVGVPAGLGSATCRRPANESSVTVYVTVDEEFARGILAQFERETGIKVRAVTDSEAGKTTGLVSRIRQESASPRADVFWSGEIYNTILLAKEGLLEPYDSPTASDIPAVFRDSQHRWTGTSVRARVIGFDTKRMNPEKVPRKWEELASEEWAKHVVFANPLFGTTRGHVAAMFAMWGPERGRAFLTDLHRNGARMVSGNSTAVRTVAAGEALLALTDTDDVWVAQRTNPSMELAYPDMGDGGTVLVPCTVAILKGARNQAGARQLADFLVSAEVERLLARTDSRNVPVRANLRSELNMEMPKGVSIDFETIADSMDEAMEAVREILIR